MVSAFVSLHDGWLAVPESIVTEMESQGVHLSPDEKDSTVLFEYGGEVGY